MNKIVNLFTILTVLSLASCTMEKRLYSSGFHINWKGDNDADVSKVEVDTMSTKMKSTQAHIYTKTKSKRFSNNGTAQNLMNKSVLNSAIASNSYNIKELPKIKESAINTIHDLKLTKSLKEEIKFSLENKNFKNQKSTPQPRRKEMSLFTKLGLILLGIGLLLLIISFWSWYFTLFGISTTYVVPDMFLFAGGASLIAGLLLLIIRWVTA